ncbi:MAG: serine protease [Bacteroidetes bacterium HGW-Bacteroidetes-6]|jgi:hypothetical protein|nr:MAG: serine protease [Bacteroidetes bacterium HGW-Bacteroidetes-6]
MKKFLLINVIVFLSVFRVSADEGMWLPLLIDRLNYTDMQKMGLQLTAEEIYSINHSSLKDAIVSMNDGMCTAFMVSKEGLMMTNHHCGLEYITENSIKYNSDYVQNGFWALDKKQELYNPNLKATFLVRIEDVSQKIMGQLNESMTPEERQNKIDEISKEIVEESLKGTHYEGEVRSFFKGNEFYMFIYEVFRDVRLVGAPPMAIGNFGADSDNWLWPRHTADFSFFRVYMGPDGKPAPYDKRKNIPYVPKYSIPVSIKGVQQGDFTMVMGYPGTTDRFMTSSGLKMTLDVINPSIVKIRDSKLRLMKEDMDRDPSIRLMYRSKYNRSSNYWKYYIGQTEVLKRLKAMDQKKTMEEDFTKWVNADASRKTKYGDALTIINDAYAEITKYRKALIYYRECVTRGPEIISFANKFDSLNYYLNSTDLPEEQKAAKVADLSTKLKYYASNYYFNSYNVDVDKKVFISLLRIMKDDIGSEFYPTVFDEVDKKFKDNFTLYANFVFEKSIFASKELVYEFLREPNGKTLEKDPGFIAMKSFNAKYLDIKDQTDVIEQKLAKGERIYMNGIMTMLNGKRKFYPDANSTMRLTYGKVVSYTPTDGAETPYYTTIDELMKREDPNNPEFIVPEKLKDLYNKKDFGQYTDKNGTIPVDFLTDCDVTGGNSGAPILNGKGELVGIVFDINWEATASSLSYIPNQTRTISTDIRYILFLIEKYAEATNIIQELDIRK